MPRLGLCLALAAVTLCGCKKPKPAETPATTPATTTVVTATATPVPPNTNYQPGGDANILNAAKRTALLAQMHGIGTLIEVDYTTSGKMPTLDAVMKSLDQATAQAVRDGRIVFCWTAQHDGIWAYEGGADAQGGVVLVGGVARRADADEVKRLLGR